MNAPTFGIAGLSHAQLMLRVARADLHDAQINVHAVGSTVLVHFWQNVIVDAKRQVAMWEQVAEMGA